VKAQSSTYRKIQKSESNSKIVFHCSAGIGRTGTIIAIYNIIESLKILINHQPNKQQFLDKLLNEAKQKSTLAQEASESVNLENVGRQCGPRISIFGVVRRLREQRYCMVQSVSQYEFIYEYIVDYLSKEGLIRTRFPRNTFGQEELECENEEEPEEEQQDEGTDLVLPPPKRKGQEGTIQNIKKPLLVLEEEEEDNCDRDGEDEAYEPSSEQTRDNTKIYQ